MPSPAKREGVLYHPCEVTRLAETGIAVRQTAGLYAGMRNMFRMETLRLPKNSGIGLAACAAEERNV